MSALAQAMPATGLRFTPDQLFGLLLYREQGKSVREISLVLHLSETAIADALAQGEAGVIEKAAGAVGNSLRLVDDRRSGQHTFADGRKTELFLPRWQRAVLRALARNDGVLTAAGVNALRSTYLDGVEAGMEPLNVGLRTSGLGWVLQQRQGEAVYQITDAQLVRLRALIANRWQQVDA